MQNTSHNFTQRVPVYYGWISVIIASFAMTATLPGRTHGLGLITEALLSDLGLSHTTYAHINLVCALVGAAFCIPAGYLIDRLGVRKTLSLVILLLGVAVFAMARVQSALTLMITLLIVRGLGQSALSVVSIAIVGKWFRRRLSAAMGVFAVLLTIGFIVTILGMGAAVQEYGWRHAWTILSISLVAFLPIAWLFTRDTPESCGIVPDDPEPETENLESVYDFTYAEAVCSPAFWIFACGAASFNLVWAGLTLFNESILGERGFDAEIAAQVLAILAGCGLVANLIAGALATRERMGKILAVGLVILAIALFGFPSINSPVQLWMYAVAIGLTGGIVTVIFFSAWGHLFGRQNLGKIQGLAQVITVFASASGPLIFSVLRDLTGAYTMAFYTLATLVSIAALAAFLVRPPVIKDSVL